MREFREKSESALQRINEYLKQNNFKTWEVDFDKADYRHYTEIEYKNKTILTYFVGHKNDIKLEYCYNQKTPFLFYNSKIANEVTRYNKLKADGTLKNEYILLDKKPEPTWTSERAIQVGREFINACFGSMPEGLDKGKCEFYVSETPIFEERDGKTVKENGSPKRIGASYRIPYWRVEFRRVNKKGIPFQNDNINLEIYESVGPTLLGVHLNSTYEEIEAELLKQEQIMPTAIESAKKIIERGCLDGWFINGQINEIPAATRLEIVNPNHALEMSNVPDTEETDLQARLAWVIWFEWKANNPKSHRNKGALAVWIDAYTGLPLGGDGF